MSELSDGPIVSSAGLDFLAEDTVALPRGSLVLWMVSAIENLENAVNAVAANDIDRLRLEFEAFASNAKAAGGAIQAAIVQMQGEVPSADPPAFVPFIEISRRHDDPAGPEPSGYAVSLWFQADAWMVAWEGADYTQAKIEAEYRARILGHPITDRVAEAEEAAGPGRCL